MDKDDYIKEGLRQLASIHYTEVTDTPDPTELANQLMKTINDLFEANQIDKTNNRFLSQTAKQNSWGEMYLLPKVHKLSSEEIIQAETHSLKSLNKTIPGRPIIAQCGGRRTDDDELMLNVLRCHLTYQGQVVTNAEARFNKSHIRKVYACLAVTCHLHFWQNDRDFLRATVVTRGWNGYRNKSQHRKSTLEKKILPPFQQGFEPATFQSRVRCSNHWAIPAPIPLLFLPPSWSSGGCVPPPE